MADKLVQQNFNEIIIDDGSVKVPIRNRHGEQIGEFSFRPTDIGIVDRFNSVAVEFDKIVEPLESVNIKPDGTVDEQNEAEFAALREAEKRLYAACDRLFGGAYISRQFDREVKKVNSRVERYTHGYRTGKHKGGKK